MKEYDIWKATIKKRIERARAVVLFLDFDGTISPTVPRPEDAYLPTRTRRALKKINRGMPICIITGRPLKVIQKKVGIPELIYGASHGLELSWRGTVTIRRVPDSILRALAMIRRGVQRLCARYPELINEPKPFAVTFHYHLLSRLNARSFAPDMKNLLERATADGGLRIFHDKKTVDIVPARNWTKGDMAQFLLRRLAKKIGARILPIYIGDSSTDEDAFRALKRGVTIRVGRIRTSAAQYYFKNRRQVDTFLFWLAAYHKKPRC